MTSLKIPRGTSIVELANLAFSKAWRVFENPYGGVGDAGQQRIGRACPHKGVKGLDNIEKLGGKYPNMVRAIRANISTAKSVAGGVHGVCVAPIKGEYKVMPRAAAMMAVHAGNLNEKDITPVSNVAKGQRTILRLSGSAPIALPGYE